jgi:hypothetical protein
MLPSCSNSPGILSLSLSPSMLVGSLLFHPFVSGALCMQCSIVRTSASFRCNLCM